MAGLTLSGLKKNYGNLTVLNSIDLTVQNGEFLVLVGPSGCGKSTLLRMIAGLEDITAGDLNIDDIRVNDLTPQKRNIAMVFQSYALFPHMTVEKNISFGLRIRHETADRIKQKVTRAVEMLNLGDYLDRLPSQLSGGQRQRVAMGRSIVRNPDLFLFDEPLSNLDAKLRVQMRAEIKSLHQKLDATIIYVTHDQIEAMTMADRIVVMKHGHIEQVGAPLELYDKPETIFVAGFLGTPSMNFLVGQFVADENKFSLKNGPCITVPERPDNVSDSITLGVRPEALGIDESGDIPFQIEVVEPTGAETMVSGRIGNQATRLVMRDRLDVKSGDSLTLKISAGNTHYFDTASGKRLS